MKTRLTMHFNPLRSALLRAAAILCMLGAAFVANAFAQSRDSVPPPPRNPFLHRGDEGSGFGGEIGKLDSGLFAGIHSRQRSPQESDTLNPPNGGGKDSVPTPPNPPNGGGNDSIPTPPNPPKGGGNDSIPTPPNPPNGGGNDSIPTPPNPPKGGGGDSVKLPIIIDSLPPNRGHDTLNIGTLDSLRKADSLARAREDSLIISRLDSLRGTDTLRQPPPPPRDTLTASQLDSMKNR